MYFLRSYQRSRSKEKEKVLTPQVINLNDSDARPNVSTSVQNENNPPKKERSQSKERPLSPSAVVLHKDTKERPRSHHDALPPAPKSSTVGSTRPKSLQEPVSRSGDEVKNEPLNSIYDTPLPLPISRPTSPESTLSAGSSSTRTGTTTRALSPTMDTSIGSQCIDINRMLAPHGSIPIPGGMAGSPPRALVSPLGFSCSLQVPQVEDCGDRKTCDVLKYFDFRKVVSDDDEEDYEPCMLRTILHPGSVESATSNASVDPRRLSARARHHPDDVRPDQQKIEPPSTASSGVSAGSPSSSGQSSPEPPPAPPSHRHKQHLIRRVLQAPLGGNNQQGVSGASKAKAQTRAEHRDAQKAAAAAAAAAAMHNSNSVKDLRLSQGPTGAGVMGPMQPPMYQPPAALYDDDPGIMSEVETSATGLRRGTKARSSLPIVRTPNKTNERPLDPSDFAGGIYAYNEYGSAMMMSLGLVFLQYRNETKRALLPNEITSMDTVKALFVRSFPRQLTMEYLDSAIIRIYIHDPARDMFYELEDLRDIRDRSVLRIYEHDPQSGAPIVFAPAPMHPQEDMSYFSEPEFDSDYPNNHSMHRQRGPPPCPPPKGSNYYGVPMYANRAGPPQPPMRPYSPAASERTMRTVPPGAVAAPQTGFSQTLPRGMTYSGVVPMIADDKRQVVPMSQSHHDLNPKVGPPKPQRLAGFTPQGVSPLGSPHSPQPPTARVPIPGRAYNPHEMMPRSRTPEGYLSSPERSSRIIYEADQFFDPRLAQGPPGGGPLVDEEARLRVEYMERQLASLTGLVHKALAPSGPTPHGSSVNVQGGHHGIGAPNRPQHLIPTRDTDKDGSSPSSTLAMPISKSRQSFKEEKSVSFCESTLTPSTHSPSQADRPIKPALKGFRSYSVSDADYIAASNPPALPDKESRLNKPPPPPKPASLAQKGEFRIFARSKSKSHQNVPPEMCVQLRQLRKQSKDLRVEIRNLRRMAQAQAAAQRDAVKDTCTKINEAIAQVKSAQEKEDAESTCKDRKKVSREETSYNADATRLEKDLAELETQVEELRSNVINRRCRVNMSNVESMALVLSKASKTVADLKNRFPSLQDTMKTVISAEMETVVREEKFLKEEPERLENALRRCKKLTGTLVTLKRLASVQEQRHTSLPEKSVSTDGPHSDGEPTQASQSRVSLPPGGSSGLSGNGSSNRERRRSENALDALLDELQTFSPRSAESPSKKSLPVEAVSVSGDNRSKSTTPPGNVGKKTPPPPPPRTTSKSPVQSPTGNGHQQTARRCQSEPPSIRKISEQNSSGSSESVNSQEGTQNRQELLEQRHQELLKKQKLLQEQYARLQLLQKLSPPKPDLKKTGSESNILHKASGICTSHTSGSLTSLACPPAQKLTSSPSQPQLARNKIYETDIL
ncbi:coiled-coil domain-containing protein AGAP005037 [Galendromus occidentalis]|uniref:Coiled-coil domain-containing protein AGAP005037 n=1 Tax=Galendromus occidentalis TaxID=34638 RepID=A0AAJ7WI03_9ACAR|nr:coiled-coil domain-containing protein AGAP005037 [Galendromus occidentalis]